MTDDTDPQTERLVNRIEEQHERIDDIEETVQQMLPSRRQLLAGAGIAGASALAGGALTGGASAAPQGQIGTSSTPVDTIYASTLDVGTAKYDQVDVDTNLAVNSLDTEKGPSNIRNASPGDVQTEIDAAASESGRTELRLDAETEYSPGATWTIKSGVTLNYNGAKRVVTSDVNVHEIKSDARVIQPEVDTTGVTFSSAVYWFNASDKLDQSHQPVIDGGFAEGTPSEGSLVKIEDNGYAVYDQDISTSADGYAIVFDLITNGGFINANRFAGYYNNYDVGIKQTATSGSSINANKFACSLQTGTNSIRAWDLQVGEGNVFEGWMWDQQNYSNEVWRIGSSASGANELRNLTGQIDGSEVTDNLGDGSNKVTIRGHTPGFPAPQNASSYASGPNADASGGVNTTAVGKSAVASGDPDATAYGYNSDATAKNAIALGSKSTANSQEAQALGVASTASAEKAIALGWLAEASGIRSFHVGFNTTTSTDGLARIDLDQLAFGAVQDTVSDTDLNQQEMVVEADETNNQFVLRYKDSGGTVQTATIAW